MVVLRLDARRRTARIGAGRPGGVGLRDDGDGREGGEPRRYHTAAGPRRGDAVFSEPRAAARRARLGSSATRSSQRSRSPSASRTRRAGGAAGCGSLGAASSRRSLSARAEFFPAKGPASEGVGEITVSPARACRIGVGGLRLPTWPLRASLSALGYITPLVEGARILRGSLVSMA